MDVPGSALRVAMILSAGLAALSVAAAARASEICPFRQIRGEEMPGVRLDSWYSEIRRELPTSLKCSEDGCQYIDEHGYHISLTPLAVWSPGHPADRYVYLKEAIRSRGGVLPYGVKWSDTREEVVRKARAAGKERRLIFDDDPDAISITGCMAPGLSDPFGTEFHFGRRGLLVRVKQSVLYP